MTKILETERLFLRSWTLDDAQRLFEICRDAEVMRYIGTGNPYENVEQAKEFLKWATNYERENGFCRWAVVEKITGKIVGSCGFARPHGTEEIELGYLFARQSWGQGLATEAARAMLSYGFGKLRFREIIAMTDAENHASRKILQKIGFTERGIERIAGEDTLVYIAENPGIFNE